MAASLVYRLTGGPANSDPDASLGGVMSSVEVSAVNLNNVFDNISPAEAQAGHVDYRALDIYNEGDETAEAITFWITNSVFGAPDTTVEVGLDATTQTIPNETTAPSGISFSEPSGGTPLVISNISVGSAQRIWFKRTCVAGAGNKANDYAVLSLQYA